MSKKIVPRRVCDPVQIVPRSISLRHSVSRSSTPCPAYIETFEFIAGLARCARTFLWLRNQYPAPDGRKRSKMPP